MERYAERRLSSIPPRRMSIVMNWLSQQSDRDALLRKVLDEATRRSNDDPVNFVQADIIRTRSYSPVVRADSWLAICWATSSFPPLRRFCNARHTEERVPISVTIPAQG